MSQLLDRLSPFVLIAVGWFTIATAPRDDDVMRPFMIAGGVVLIACGAFLYGVRRTIAQFEQARDDVLDKLPGSLVFHRDDEGQTHALVTTIGGDVRTIQVPEDFAGSPAEAAAYVFAVLSDEVDA